MFSIPTKNPSPKWVNLSAIALGLSLSGGPTVLPAAADSSIAPPLPSPAETDAVIPQPVPKADIVLDPHAFLNADASLSDTTPPDVAGVLSLPALAEWSTPVPPLTLAQRTGPNRVPLPNQPSQEVEPPEQLPPPAQLLQPPGSAPQEELPEVPGTITVDQFDVEGSTVFSAAELAAVTEPFTKRPITFAELLQARTAVTQLYTEKGYVTSGAFIPPQTLENGTVKIQVVEGTVESINVTGNHRLRKDYVRSRIAIATDSPLNVNQLLKALQLLQLDPLIKNISAELAAGAKPGTSVIEVSIIEADSFNTQFVFDNQRNPSVGSFRRQVNFTQANLLGFGDGLSVTYTNTDGSNEVEGSYTFPLNPHNGTLNLYYSLSGSKIIEDPFDVLDIESDSEQFEITFRQPIIRTPSQELALGLTGSLQNSQTSLLGVDFPLSPGADLEGNTRISALRFFQEWTQRGSRSVLAARSQFSFGLDAFDATQNEEELPDSQFLAWRGQLQWLRLLAPDTLLLLRSDVQLANDSLLPLEQFGVGGQTTVRGYRQDARLSDNGLFLSAEVRIPVFRSTNRETIVQLAPFVDFGHTWNHRGPALDPDDLLGVGLGLRWQQSDWLSVRLDWGIPLIELDDSDRTWQENGFYFSVIVNPF